jgi:Flp pilus assembly protein TadD
MAHANLAIALGIQGKLKEALKEDEKAVALSPGSAEFHFGMAMHLQQLGRPDEAVSQYELAARLRPDFAEARQGHATALYFAGRYAEAWKAVHEYVRLGGTPNPDFLRALSEKMPDPGG